MLEMDTRIDFLQCLDPDMSLTILMYLDDPADLMRASCVSHFWQNFVIANGVSKKLCERKFPQIANDYKVESNCKSKVATSAEQLIRERDHQVFASLFQALTKFPLNYCIALAVSASSTDNYPEESIAKTLDPRDRILFGASYWSSKGSNDPEVPESLIYHLNAGVSAITEVNIHPFQAYFQQGSPIYSSRSVRFRLGHRKCLGVLDHNFLELQEHADDKFVWTYTSQEFPMVQENRLQRFKLPEPAICMGGFLKVEFLGRIQECKIDNLFYICVSHVQAIGRSLSPAFEFFSEPPILRYNSECFNQTVQSLDDGSLSSYLPPLSPPDDFDPFNHFDHFMEVEDLQEAPEPFYIGGWMKLDNNEHDHDHDVL